jgi:ArsR family transcriptional regulator, arsenate/arsenite/antimonite-responsive transcriptional repressor / arsenate reductase (thioredoxin)
VEPALAPDPPRFVRLIAHPLRWQLLRELVQSDRAVRELTELIDEPQSLVSYHLRQLRDGGLVFARRSSADGRDSYYAIDLGACQESLQAAGGSLHPALWLAPVPPPGTPSLHSLRRRRVLFLCTGNSTRSQIAEALLERMSDGTVEAASAGSHPKPLHPNAVRVLKKRGIDISGHRTKHLDEFLSQRFDMVITLCDRVREVCPESPTPRSKARPIAPPTRRSNAPRPSSRHVSASCSTCWPANPRQGGHPMPANEIVNVRYMVDDVDESIAFYTKLLGFELLTSAAPAFADVKRGNLRLLLAGPASSAGRPMPDGTKPGPGGWNRIHFLVDDIDAEVAQLRDAGARFRNDIVEGPGGKQILLQDPSGNVVELFQPAAR